MVNIKKSIAVAVIPILALTVLVSVPSSIRADDNEQHVSNVTGEVNQNGTISNSDDQKNNDNQDQNQEEDDIHSHTDSLKDIGSEVQDPETDSNSLTTYADVVTNLQVYLNAVDQIGNATSTLQTQLGSTLNPQELALFNILIQHHTTDFARLNARVAEIHSQIQTLINALTPLGTQQISPSLKNLISSTLQNYHEQIKNLSDFENLDIQAVNDETE